MGHHYVLVHGACHGAWEWYRLSDRLQKAGNRVTALDLAGCGIRPENPDTITSFVEYNKPLEDFMASFADDEKVRDRSHVQSDRRRCDLEDLNSCKVED